MIYIIARSYSIASDIARNKDLKLNQWNFIDEPYLLKGLEAPTVILHGSAQERRDFREIEELLVSRRAKVTENWS